MSDPLTTTHGKIVFGFFGFVLLCLLYRAFLWSPNLPPKPEPVACEGQPIFVDYPFKSGWLEPHACKIQCTDQSTEHFVFYNNNTATQCEKLPGCLDYGEDHGTTCVPPAGTVHPGMQSNS